MQTVSGITVYTKTFAKCKENKVYSFQWDGRNNKGQYVKEATYRLCITAGTVKTYSSEMKFYNNADFAGGNGSKSRPYQVKTLAQLKKITKYNGRYFVQEANINGDDANFQPLFTSDNPFMGDYNGKGYTISNLYFRATGWHSDSGLFDVIGKEGKVQNVKVSNFTIISSANITSIGMVAGSNNGIITKCDVENSTINSSSTGSNHSHNSGGICGYNTGIIESCTVKGISVNGDFGGKAGGIVGRTQGKVIDCTAEDIVIVVGSLGSIGGIVGFAENCFISGCNTVGNCSFTSDSSTDLGAIAGKSSNSTITDCYTDTEYNLVGYKD